MMPIAVTADIDRPPDEVFAFVSDVENNPRWQRGMRSCTWTSPPPHSERATYDQVAHFLGRDVVSKFVVTRHEPGRRVTFTTVESPFPITETRLVEPLDGGKSRVIAVVEGDASRFFPLARPFLRPMVQRSVRADYARLRRLLA